MAQGNQNRRLLQAAQEGMKRNFLPGLALQVIALSIVLAYYFMPSSHALFDRLVQLKVRYGYSIISTAVFGGLLPFVYLALSGRVNRQLFYAEAAFFVIFWGFRGFDVDLFYHFQAFLFGTDPGLGVVVKKVLFDQFCYNVIWSTPMMTLAYLWKDCGFSWAEFKQHLNRDLFAFNIPSVMLSNWGVWIPAVSIIYSLPAPLQIPLFNLVLLFWVLIMNFISQYHKNDGAPAPIVSA